jgi:hypothetical protein
MLHLQRFHPQQSVTSKERFDSLAPAGTEQLPPDSSSHRCSHDDASNRRHVAGAWRSSTLFLSLTLGDVCRLLMLAAGNPLLRQSDGRNALDIIGSRCIAADAALQAAVDNAILSLDTRWSAAADAAAAASASHSHLKRQFVHPSTLSCAAKV